MSSTGTCGEQGAGQRERSRTKSYDGSNGGQSCEADSMKESWLCCPDKTTDPRSDADDGCAEEDDLCGGIENTTSIILHNTDKNSFIFD